MRSPLANVLTAFSLLAMLCVSSARAESPEERALRAIMDLPNTPTEQALQWFEQSTLPPDPESILKTASRSLDVGSNPQVRKIQFFTKKSLNHDLRHDSFVFHIVGDSNAALVAVSVRTEGGSMVITQFHVEPAPKDLAARFPFTLSGMSWLHYLCLVLGAFFLLVQVAAVIQCIRSRSNRKWLWIPFSLLGVGQLSLTWVPGPLSKIPFQFKPISIMLSSLSMQKMPIYQPWVLSISFPLGALLLFRRLRKLRRQPPEEPVSILSVDELEVPESASPFGPR